MPCKNTFVQNLNRKSPLHKVSRRKVLWKFCGRNRENDLGRQSSKLDALLPRIITELQNDMPADMSVEKMWPLLPRIIDAHK